MNIEKVNEAVFKTAMLEHPFYQKWNRGELSIDTLQYYVKEYYHFEEIFPRCVALAYAKCDDLADRNVLFGNLADELSSPETHLDLWVKFANSLGVTSEELLSHAPNKYTQELIDGYWEMSNKSYAAAVSAMYAYETQVPEVAKTKIETLKKHYNLSSESALKFFQVHLSADEWHSEECAALINKLSDAEKEESVKCARQASELLWGFLDGVLEYDNSKKEVAA